MRLDQIIGLPSTEEIIDAAFCHPQMVIKPRSTKRPTLDDALKATSIQAQNAIIKTVGDQALEALQDAYDMYVMINGEHDDSDAKSDWESGIDDVIEETLAPWQEHLSADWLGRNTIDTHVWQPLELEKLAASVGKEFFKEITTGKTSNQILSSLGIVTPQVEARLAAHLAPSPEKEQDMKQKQTADLDSVAQKLAARLGKGFDIMAVYDDLDLASDDDDGLAQGAAGRLGLDENDVLVLQAVRMTYGDDAIETITTRIQQYTEGKAPAAKEKAAAEKPAAKEKAAPKGKAKSKRDADTAAEEETEFDPDVLMQLRRMGAKDDDMAKKLGVSRATYNNYVAGKSILSPDGDQAEAIRNELVERLNALHEALALLDNSEPYVVF